MIEFIKGKHFGDYVQSGENIEVTHLEDEVYEFKVIIWDKYPETIHGYYEAIVITPETDLSGIPTNVLEEFDNQMYYEGECDNDWVRDAKFSETRKHIQFYIR